MLPDPLFCKSKKSQNRQKKVTEIVRVGFWQSGFFADFYFWAAGFLRGFSRRNFLLIFVREKVHRKNIPGKFPTKSSKIHTTNIPDNFLQRAKKLDLAPFRLRSR